MTRQAISPRFAIRILLNMFFLLELFGQDPHPQCAMRERG
jgi:hypothetical protein